jgi:DNA-directed RNA polymerase subunit M/transcription elongation factor TFIIS
MFKGVNTMNAKEITAVLKKCTKLTAKQQGMLTDIIIDYDESDSLLYEAIGLLNAGQSYSQVFNAFSNGCFKWNSKIYKEMYDKRTLNDLMLAKPPEIRDGEIECPKCHKKKTFIVEMQTRSADEGYTYYIHCLNPTCKAITK